mgnify:CR=1 FL=1
MPKLICLFLCLTFGAVSVSALDLEFRFTTGQSPDVKANIYITNPAGIKYECLGGGDQTTKGQCRIDRTDNDENGDLGPATLVIHPMLVIGTYTITVYGTADTEYEMTQMFENSSGQETSADYSALISSGVTQTYSVFVINTATAPTITKNATSQSLSDDIIVAQKKNWLGDNKFAASIIKQVNLQIDMLQVCNRRNGRKNYGCRPAADVLRLIISRLVLANKWCSDEGGCHPFPLGLGDEGSAISAFEKANRGDRDYDDFFRAWDKDDWHRWKKTSKRFVTDEALAIIRGDAEALIKTLGPSPKEQGKH